MKRTSHRISGVLLATLLASPGITSAAVIFADNFSEADGTVLNGKSPDVGNPWSQTAGPALSVQGNAIETQGDGRTAFGFFTRATTATEITTVTITNLQTAGTFFGSGFAGYSLFLGTNGEQVFIGDLSGSTVWGFTGGGTTALSTNSTVVNTATFTYNAITGAASLSLSDPGNTNPVATANLATGLTFDRIRFANGNTGDLKFGGITVDAVPEPSSSLLVLGAMLPCALVRRRKIG